MGKESSAKQVLLGFLLVGAVAAEFTPEHVLSTGDFAQTNFQSSAINDGSVSHGSFHNPTATSYQSFFLESKDPVPVKLASDKGRHVEYPQLPQFFPQGTTDQFQQIHLTGDNNQQQQVLLSHQGVGQQQVQQHHQIYTQQQHQPQQIQIAYNTGGDGQTHFVNQQQQQVQVQHHVVDQHNNAPAPHTIPSAEEASQVGYHAGDLSFHPTQNGHLGLQHHQQQQILQQHHPQQQQNYPEIEFQSDDYTYEIHESPRYHQN